MSRCRAVALAFFRVIACACVHMCEGFRARQRDKSPNPLSRKQNQRDKERDRCETAPRQNLFAMPR